jgi:hypothetical protein
MLGVGAFAGGVEGEEAVERSLIGQPFARAAKRNAATSIKSRHFIQVSCHDARNLLGSAKDGAQNASDIIALVATSVAAVVGAAILAESCVIALHEAIAKNLRRGVPVVV